MLCRLALAVVCLALFLSPTAEARQLSRIDLGTGETESIMPGAATPEAIAGIGFDGADVGCPEEHGTIEIRGRQIFLTRLLPGGPGTWTTQAGKGATNLRHGLPFDDQTYRYQIGDDQCELTLGVRLQVHADEGWMLVGLPYWSRPSVPKEERAALVKGMVEWMERRRENGKILAPQRFLAPQLLGDVRAAQDAFAFEESSNSNPADCFRAVGTYEIGRDGAFFTFLRGLPGGLNRFVIERNDVNSYEGRVYFEQGGCRFQITVSGSRKSGPEWVPLLIENPI
jgi:hypothetical protein